MYIKKMSDISGEEKHGGDLKQDGCRQIRLKVQWHCRNFGPVPFLPDPDPSCSNGCML